MRILGGTVRVVKNRKGTKHVEKRETLTIPEVAQILGIGRNSAFAAASRGELPTIRLGRRILVPRAALERLLEAHNRTITPAA